MEDSDFLPRFIKTSPESPEMDRRESVPVEHVPMESLRSKLRAHYRKGMRNSKPDLEPSYSISPEFVNRASVLTSYFTLFCALKMELCDVLPAVYRGQNDLILLQQCLVIFIFVEILINWIAIRYVDSSYTRHIRLYGDSYMLRQSVPRHPSRQIFAEDYSSSTVIVPLKKQAGEIKETCNKVGISSSVDANLKYTHGVFSDVEPDLMEEARRVNERMNKCNEQINSKSIEDLISVSEVQNSSSSLPNSSPEHLNPFEARSEVFDLMSPKPVISTDGSTVTEQYPYWSWVPCYACKRTRPPRCHHCPLCKTCILKRDHHCFFVGSCLGYRNYRFFIVYLFWIWIGCTYVMIHGFPHIQYIWSDISYFDFLFPIAIIRYFGGFLPFHIVLSMVTLTLTIYFWFLTASLLHTHCRLICLGLTSFEKSSLKSSLEIKDIRRISKKLRAVFGRYWFINFIFPLHFLTEPEEDPVHWPEIRIFKH